MRAPSPDMRTGVGPEAPKPKPAKPVIREVTPVDLRERTLATIHEELPKVQKFRSEKPTYITELEDARKNMLRRIGGAGEETVHELLPNIKEEFIDNRTRSNNPVEVYDFALINDAVATSSPEDIAMTIDVLEAVCNGPEDIHVQSFPFREAQDQLCYTLVRQINEIVTNDPNDTRIEEIRRRLERIRNAPRTEANEILIDHAIQLPLYLTGDEQARIKIGGSEDAYLGKYKNRQFNLDTVEFEKIKSNEGLAEYVDKETGKPVSAAEIEMQAAEPAEEPAADDQPFKTDEQRIHEVKKELAAVSNEVSGVNETLSDEQQRNIDEVLRDYYNLMNGYDIDTLDVQSRPRPADEEKIDKRAAKTIEGVGKDALPYLYKCFMDNGTIGIQRYKIAQFFSGLAGPEDLGMVLNMITDSSVVPVKYLHRMMANGELNSVLATSIYSLRLNDPKDQRLVEISKDIITKLKENTGQKMSSIVRNQLHEDLALTGTKEAREYIDREIRDSNDNRVERSYTTINLLYTNEDDYIPQYASYQHSSMRFSKFYFETAKSESLNNDQIRELGQNASETLPLAA